MRTKDHVVPKSKGGRKTVDACLKCNSAKADMSLDEFRWVRGGIEFWGEKQHRLEAEKTDWIYEFDPKNASITPSYEPASSFSSLSAIRRTSAKPHVPPPPPRQDNGLPYGLPDLRGVKFGGWTVVRYLGKIGAKNSTPMWEVICLCGAKENRTTRAIRNPANSFDACVECRRPVGKLRSDIFKETGIQLSWDDCFLYTYRDHFEKQQEEPW